MFTNSATALFQNSIIPITFIKKYFILIRNTPFKNVLETLNHQILLTFLAFTCKFDSYFFKDPFSHKILLKYERI